jgi:hypothetical protein
MKFTLNYNKQAGNSCDYENMIMSLLKNIDPKNKYFTQALAYQKVQNEFVKGYLLTMEEGVFFNYDLVRRSFMLRRNSLSFFLKFALLFLFSIKTE